MSNAVYISSCIEINAAAPLSYAQTRSCFSTEERYRQTIATVNNLICHNPTATIYVVDASEQYMRYATELPRVFPRCVFVPIRDMTAPAEYDLIRRHPNKSLGESLILRNFLVAYHQELQQYDFLFKMSGRYLLTSTYQESVFTQDRLNQIFFKTPLSFEWNTAWGYDKVDLRHEEGHNRLNQYCSVFYGYGKHHLPTFTQLYQGMASILKHPSMIHYDVETLLYFLLNDYRTSIVTLPVQVLGWQGPDGKFLLY